MKVAMAVTAVSADEHRRLALHTLENMAGLVPSFTYSQLAGFGQVTIRGIGTNAVFAGSDPSVAVYLDGIYLARPTMLLNDFANVDRIEVLRGPQGTLYGRNAVGGAINIITRAPSDTYQASGAVTLGGYRKRRVEGFASGPLWNENVTASIGFTRGVRDGVVQDLEHPDRPLGGEDASAGQAQLRLRLGTRSEVSLAGDVVHQDFVPLVFNKAIMVKPGMSIDNPGDLHTVRTSSLAESRNHQRGLTVRARYAAPGITLTSLTGIRRLDYDIVVDSDISELALRETGIAETHRQLSQEFAVTGGGSGLDWIGGVFLFDERDEQPSFVRALPSGVESRFSPKVDAGASAVFGQATVPISQTVRVTAGARYSDEKKRIHNSGGVYRFGTGELVSGSGYEYVDEVRYSAWTPKVGLEIHPAAKTLLYASAARGFKSGGFNFTSREPGRGFDPEYAWSYEAGGKASFADGRMQLRSSAFFTDYTNLQVQSVIGPGVLDIRNAAAATIRGAEIETTARARPWLSLGGFLSWLDARYDRYLAVGPGNVTRDVAGNRLNNAPKWGTRVWLESVVPVRSAGALQVRVDRTRQSEVFFTPFNDEIEKQSGYSLSHLTVQFLPTGGRWHLSAYVKNLTNTGYITSTGSTSPTAIGGRPGEPRQFGLRFGARR